MRNVKLSTALHGSGNVSNLLVLDVGSGYHPDPRAHVLLEKFLTGTKSRYKERVLVRKKQTLICGDIEAMPFGDKVFDAVICRQTLEHVDDPEAACTELVRVAKSGYITAPDEDSTRKDIGAGRRLYHKWLLRMGPHVTYGNHLHFFPRELVPSLSKSGYSHRHVIMYWINEFFCHVHKDDSRWHIIP